MRASLLLFAASLGPGASAEKSPAPQERGSAIERWLREKVTSRTTVSGWRKLGYHVRRVDGDTASYDVTEYGGRGLSRFTDFGYVRVTGFKVLDVLNFDVNVQDSRFQDPQANRFSVDYDGGGFSANLGDIRGSLGGANPHARFDRSLSGVQAGYKGGGFEIRALRSQARGQARTVSFPGTNSAGPYYLQSSQIVRGSERIEVDGELLTLGEDYTIDYELGAVYFVNRQTLQARIIPPTSTIVATYEAFNFGGASGTIEGASASYDAGSLGKLGVTAMRQRSGASGQGSGRLERFQGFGPPSTPYVLQFEPVSVLSVVIRVDGVLQVRGVDYRFDPNNAAVFYMTRFVPSTSTIDVLYTPKAVSTIDGDRSVVGVDYTLPLGRGSRLLLSQATGELTNTAEPKRGVARSADVRWRNGGLELGAGVRDVPIGFVGIETTGFERNERTADLSASYRPNERVALDALYRNSSISSQTGSGASARTVSNRLTRAEAGYQLTPERGMPLRLRHTRTTGTGVRGRSTVDTSSLGTSYNRGLWSLGIDAVNRSARGPFTLGGGSQTGTVDSQGLDVRAAYNGGERFGATLFAGLSRIRAAGQSGIGRDVALGLSYRPSDNLELRLDAADSDGGNLATLGFDSGIGAGYDGNGFSAGAGADAFISATDARSVQLTASYSPSEQFAASATASVSRRSGGISSNSETVGGGVGLTWTFGAPLTLDLSLDASRTRFFETPGESTAVTASLRLEGAPRGRFSYRTGLTALLTGGSGDFAQDSLAFDASLNYLLAERHNLNLSLDVGQLRGYLPQDSRTFGVTYQYQIWRSLAFNVGYRWIDVQNTTPGLTTGAYRSSGFDFELEFNFGG